MKIYFSASRYYRNKYVDNYTKIVEVLKKKGFEVLDNSRVNVLDGDFEITKEQSTTVYKKMLKMMDKADVSVFEASYPSTLHIGHEISLILGKNKPAIVLYSEGNEPYLFKGIKDDKIIWVEYNSDNLKAELTRALDEAQKIVDVRFNFFVSPKILTYLDWISQKKMVPRSVFLRNLIEREMKKDKSFK